VNEVAQIIYKLGAGLGENKTGQRSDGTLLSCKVTPIELRSNLLLVDLERLDKDNRCLNIDNQYLKSIS